MSFLALLYDIVCESGFYPRKIWKEVGGIWLSLY